VTGSEYQQAKRLIGTRLRSTVNRYLCRMTPMTRNDIKDSLETDFLIYMHQRHEQESPDSVFTEWLEERMRVEWIYLRNRVIDVIRFGRYNNGVGHRAFDSHMMPGAFSPEFYDSYANREPGFIAVDINDTLNFYFTPRQIEAVNMRVSDPQMSKVKIAKKMGIDWREVDRIYDRVKEVIQ
jgi:hypothetical protein